MEYKYKWSDKYHADYKNALVDGILGSTEFKDGNWQGFEGEDLDVTVSLKEVKEIKQVRINFLENEASWIFLPENVKVFYSVDGVEFNEFKKSPDYLDTGGIIVYTFKMEGVRAKYYRIVAENIGNCPPGHPGEGGKAWLFVDEVVIN